MTRNTVQKQNHLIRKRQFTLFTAAHLNSFISYRASDCLYAQHIVRPNGYATEMCLSNTPEGG